MRVVDQARAFAVRAVANSLTGLLCGCSDDKLLALVRALRAVALRPEHRRQLVALEQLFRQQHPALGLAHRLFRDTSPAARRSLVNNLGVNHTYLGAARRHDRVARGLGAPSLLVISPTMRCNLRCSGCYAGEYDRQDDLPLEVMDRVLREAKEMGIHFCVISGGEAFVRPDLYDLYAEHHDCHFLVYSNGTLINEQVAARLGELGNVGPAVSVEGFREETDARRGPGTWDKIMHTMDLLREAGVIFGYSATVTRDNADTVSSEGLVDLMLAKGCYFGWYFMYLPIGREPETALMPTVEQRRRCGQRVAGYRDRKPIFVADFWNDGQLTGGCMAGGRMYLHVTSSGWVEPCVFAHFTVDNVKEKSLAEILESPFFRALRRRFPWTDNELTPCAIIDNPWVLREAVAEGGARPSHPGAETILTDLAGDLDEYSAALHEATAEDWAAIEARRQEHAPVVGGCAPPLVA